jgi:hypothetical protein
MIRTPRSAPPRRGGRLVAAAALLACTAAASAQLGDTLDVPREFPSVQAAHDAAQSGDTILVAPGTYVGPLVLSKAVTVASHHLLNGDRTLVDRTILDGGGGSHVISIPSGAEDRPVVHGFTIRNAGDGVSPHAPFELWHCVVRDTSDGIDYEDGSGGLVRACTFVDNSDDGIDLDEAVDVVIDDNVIRDNGDDGIEIRMQQHDGPLQQIVITRNAIHDNGEDGIQLIHYDVFTQRFLEISHNVIHGNAAAGIGMMDSGKTEEDFRAADIPEPIHVLNNTFAGNSHGITGGDNAVVLNNVFVGHPQIAVKQVDAGSVLAYNLFFGNGTDNSQSNVDDASSVHADPLLTALLELRLGSPAIDAGTAFYAWNGVTVLDLPPEAYAGAAPDLGAHELGRPSASIPYAPPVEPTTSAPSASQ